MALDLSKFRLMPLSGDGRDNIQGRAFILGTADDEATIEAAGYINGLVNLAIPYGDRSIYPGDLIFVNFLVGAGGQTWKGYQVSYTAGTTSALDVYTLVELDLGTGGGGGSVSSVFSRTGAVAAANGDYTAAQVTNVAAGGIVSTTVQAAINELDTGKAPLASPTFTGTVEGVNATFSGTMGAVTVTAGSLSLSPLGGTITVATGTNSCAGTLTLNGATPVVVSTTAVTANSIILLTRQTNAGTPNNFSITARSAGASFTVTGTALDTSTVGYLIIN